jgi:predicted transposase YdaD
MEHDSGYKLLFPHPQMVADLLRGFVHEPWVEKLDFSTLEKVSGSYVTDDLRSREDDIIWRARWGEEWIYLYLLLEFQSSIDPFMSLRIMNYLSLLYQDIVRTEKLGASDLLPPVLPLVLYNGDRPWNATQEISELIQPAPDGLEVYRPSMRYLLLDEGRIAASELEPLRNLVAALFRLENSRSAETICEVLGLLIEWLHDETQTPLRRAFTEWVNKVLLPGKAPGIEPGKVSELSEVKNMLAQRIEEWTQGWKQEGIEKGREEGREEGRKEGREKGFIEGEAVFLVRQLEIKFGPLEQLDIAMIKAADAGRLCIWGERVLTAGSLAEVLAEG